ncbi:hypothetical protein AVEN_180400-1 [Araneus ventricosus]|uniref:Uncharacterized protein n=1 Tax=Araneus ventricosus TaxID=182803 RepID=A0A4Y2T3H8_ARAVE|nr:hypothetical protein AVEN_100302-1 [Araneus ventricosus]GBN94772.1 hypothetical protein AVEN_236595-1 [Araneus ventricosus]GBN94799.1 hypothetical protein AVEN_131818-1 [Araneus ventricosus]GBN94802.1 hypothetical protein AVEN_180400-1 [Araneus ventricosus]
MGKTDEVEYSQSLARELLKLSESNVIVEGLKMGTLQEYGKQRGHNFSVGTRERVPPLTISLLLYPTGQRSSAYLYGKFLSAVMWLLGKCVQRRVVAP